MHADRLRARLCGEISGALSEIVGSPVEVVLAVNKVRTRVLAEPRAASRSAADYTFDNFVVGSSNQLAHAAAIDAAARPGQAFNPLFLHGGVGLGKTHLATAIANQLRQQSHRRVALLSAEAFANDLIRALLTNGLEALRARVRHLDVLVIDDVQFLAGKDRMQEEFFHTFNALHAAGRQIVLASDQPPRAIPDLEQRLQSRFDSGLTVEIRAPETPLRLAILLQKAKALGVDLPFEVAHWMATRIAASVRELEGALHRLLAAGRWGERALDVALASEVLRPLLRAVPQRTVEHVQRLVAESFQLRPDELARRGRTGKLRIPRQIAMYLARKNTNATYAEIAAGFGGRDHSTDMHAVRSVEVRLQEEPAFAVLVDGIASKMA
jgi:chromosomal replication initiator protein